VYSQWSAAMISPADDFAGAPLLRTEFALVPGHGAVLSAELAVSSLGVFEAYLNGRGAGPDVLSPGWSSYEWRLRYRTYDVTDLLQPTTVLGISLGNGWSRGRLGWNANRAFYGDRLGVIAQLEVAYADGHRQLMITDETWRAGPSATLANDLYDGQTIDARLADATWMHPGAALPGWGSVETLEPPHAVYRAAHRPPRSPPAGEHLVLAVGSHAGGLRAEPGRLAALHDPG
jgi:alpha-L-rhamnosidase